MVKKIFFSTILTLSTLIIYSQVHWEPINNNLDVGISNIEINAQGNGFIIGGKFSTNNELELDGIAEWIPELGFLTLNGGSNNCSSTIGCVHSMYAFHPFKGFTYAGLIDNNFQGEDFNGIAKWDGNVWDSLSGKLEYKLPFGIGPADARGFSVIDDTLYVGGSFQIIDSVDINSVAKWDGENWHSLNFPYPNEILDVNFVYDFIKHKGSLYICGNIAVKDSLGNIVYDIMKYDGNNWTSVGSNPLFGSFGELNCMIEYKGDLYVSGDLLKSENPEIGPGIARLRNQEWEGINKSSQSGVVIDMIVLNDLLFVVGLFDEIGGIQANDIAVFDGVNWYSFDTEFDKHITTIQELNNEIYIGGFFEYIDGIHAPYFAKLKCNPSDLTNCGIITSTINDFNENFEINVFPNPSSGYVVLTNNDSNNKLVTAEFINSNGALEKKISFRENITIKNLKKGNYIIKFYNDENILITIKKVIIID